MLNPLIRYVLLVKRWAWLLILGITLCGGITYLLDKIASPVYQASAELVIALDTSSSSDVTASIAAEPTYVQLVTNPQVLEPVIAQHRGISLEQLSAMLTVKPQPNTQLIELDVQNRNPTLAMQLANEICQSFAQYANSRLSAPVQVLPAQEPTRPIKPKPSQDVGIAALVGLGLAIALIVIFEWIDDRPGTPEQVQELLAMEILASIPRATRDQQGSGLEEEQAVVEKYRMLCASLNAVRANWPFKLVMVTSAFKGEGKTTVAANVSFLLARAGKRVLLVDANLRHPSLHQRFRLKNQFGLANVFLGAEGGPPDELYGQRTTVPTLRVLPAGSIPANPTDLLQSQRVHRLFEYFKTLPFDYIIVDAPPLLSVADAQVIVPLVEAVVLVIDPSKTPRRALSRVRQILNRTRTRVVGVALNMSRWPDCGDGDANQRHVYRRQREFASPLQQQVPIASPPPAPTPGCERSVTFRAHSLQGEPKRDFPPGFAFTHLVKAPYIYSGRRAWPKRRSARRNEKLLS